MSEPLIKLDEAVRNLRQSLHERSALPRPFRVGDMVEVSAVALHVILAHWSNSSVELPTVKQIAEAIDQHYEERDYLAVYDEAGYIVSSAAAEAVAELLGSES